MFENLGFQEITLIAIVFIVFFGPKKIPEVLNGLGRGVREFRRAMNEVKSEISNIAEPPYDGPAIHKATPRQSPAASNSTPQDTAPVATKLPPPYDATTTNTADQARHENQSSTGE